MNKIIIISSAIFIFYANTCFAQKTDKNTLVRKRIIQKIETDGMGMIKEIEIESIKKINDSIYKGIYHFQNPMFNKEVRVTQNYIFTHNLDSIKKNNLLKTEIKSEGEWVEIKNIFE